MMRIYLQFAIGSEDKEAEWAGDGRRARGEAWPWYVRWPRLARVTAR